MTATNGAPQTGATGMQGAAPTQLPSQNNTAMKRMGENISNHVLERVNAMQKAGELVLPKGYEAGNALKSAWLYLQTVENRNHQRAIDVCTKDSIANCLLEMVVKGEHPRQHCYFIMTSNVLSFWERYTGRYMRAKRDTDIKQVNAQVVYEDDNFIYTVDETGQLQLVKHETSLKNMDNSKIVGAYAVVINKDGSHHLEVMTMDMIKKAWQQGAAKGQSGAHLNFTDQMAKKTIIGRACKIALDSTEDNHEADSEEGYMAPPSDADAERTAANNEAPAQPAKVHHDDFEETAEYEEIPDDGGEEQAPVAEEPAAPAAKHGRACPI